MDYYTWIAKLKTWGLADLEPHSRATIAFYVVFVVTRWALIALAISVLAVSALIVGVVVGALKGK